MHGIFADEHRASRETQSASKIRPQISRRPHRQDDGKRPVTAEIIHAFDRPAPQRDLGRSSEATGSVPVAPAVQRHEDGQLIAHNTTRYDIGNMAKSDSDGSCQFFRNGSIHDLRNLLRGIL